MRTVNQGASLPSESNSNQRIEWTTIDRVDLEQRAAAILSTCPRPFVRWVGSKQRLLSQITKYLPDGYRTYYEPFFGAGSLYFLLRPENAVVNDSCLPLVEMYRTISSNAKEVYHALQDMNILDRDFYYTLRATHPTDPIAAAARFIYLNRGSWNGLYRVNSKGEFNVPYGRPRSANIVDEDQLLSAARALSNSNTTILGGDFEMALTNAGSGDLVFLDPPYALSGSGRSFVDYNEKLFSWDDQVRLAERAHELRLRGATVIVTNAYNKDIRDLYPEFQAFDLVRRSTLASKSSQRKNVPERLLVS